MLSCWPGLATLQCTMHSRSCGPSVLCVPEGMLDLAVASMWPDGPSSWHK